MEKLNNKPNQGCGCNALEIMKTKLVKFEVCDKCHCVGILHTDCICSYGKYKSIELEFEVCDCCGNLIKDGIPAESEFNKMKLNDYNKLICKEKI